MATYTVCSNGHAVKVSADYREVAANAARAIKENREVVSALRDATEMLRQIGRGETFRTSEFASIVREFEEILSRSEPGNSSRMMRGVPEAPPVDASGPTDGWFGPLPSER